MSTATGNEVEKILERRVRAGIVEYKLKWMNRPDLEASWEPEKSLSRQHDIAMVEAFEKQDNQKTDVNVENKKGSSKKKAYERGYTADRILGATDASGELMFLFKWQETDEVNLIPASIANLKWPQIVIQFYEARLSFHSS